MDVYKQDGRCNVTENLTLMLGLSSISSALSNVKTVVG
jgi:hypothetical protein